ncbi:DNA-processing protein DprA [Cytophagales bacterium LB-30]|uniref:DNA-processing protein DprA n=1 Tax=Shiella aurantiaca TaxID=3058365 RepID=A0ABT8F1U3_9BACT|nr:DNA-processing protein DprA [Shiella aurantiaca]MDN4164402.1 DNA-processing protein DprA [Shiella aurantiaca]
MNQEQLSLIALHMVPGLGPVGIKNLISYCGSAEEVFKKNKARLLKTPGIGPKTAEAILTPTTFDKAEAEIRNTEKQGAQILFYYSKEYPDNLKQAIDAPLLLYYKGNITLQQPRNIAIVGTRQATDYGKKITEELIEALAPYQPLIISGLAYGIDICAHKAALKYGLNTIGILGSGIDTIYPALHKETAQKMLNQGGLLSEKPLGTKPEAYHFPERNRIIAGMANLVIVVEAARKGGALLTAEIANSYDREVMAVPGSLFADHSEGCNHLIREQKAHIFTSVKDVEVLMNWPLSEDGEEKTPTKKHWQEGDFSSEEWRIVSLLQEHNKALHIDELSWRTQIPIHSVGSVLLQLEFKGCIKAQPGKMFALV